VGALMAELAARRRAPVRLSLAEMEALATVADQFRGSRDLASAVTRVRLAADRRRRAVARAGR
jgi:hypothetical protein